MKLKALRMSHHLNFADRVNCREYLFARRWRKSVACPRCRSRFPFSREVRTAGIAGKCRMARSLS
jgi:hypothetical protein